MTHKLTREELLHYLHRELNVEPINEMAVPLKDFRNRVDGLRFQLVENWCLLCYCRDFDPSNDDFKHWGAEFSACMNNLKHINIKGHSDKLKTLQNMLIKDYDYNDPYMIKRIIFDKFTYEGLDSDEILNHVSTEFADEIDSLVESISDPNQTTDGYRQRTFND